MSVRLGLLALLDQQPMYGYQLHLAFQRSTGETSPLNIGQVYTTLSRLDRDGLITAAGQDEDGHDLYALTPTGRTELERWFLTPVGRSDRPRDELAIKLAVALAVSDIDVRDVIQKQRAATMRDLQELTRQKRAIGDDDLTSLLTVESLIFQAEAEVRWLESCEQRLLAHSSRKGTRR
jgi:DNA-binding PadR family transcriptional regulator